MKNVVFIMIALLLVTGMVAKYAWSAPSAYVVGWGDAGDSFDGMDFGEGAGGDDDGDDDGGGSDDE